ncbi:MAG: rod-binding protein [Planctomycetes bacterium]|nr:rod-binding protein [Planctomycetota bacterium]
MDPLQIAPPISSLSRALDPERTAQGDPAEAAARFEALLATMLVKEMRSSLSEGFFGSGSAGDVYGGWLDEHVGKSLADRDALHLEGVLRESLERKAGRIGDAA